MGCEILSRDPFLFLVVFTPTKRLALGVLFRSLTLKDKRSQERGQASVRLQSILSLIITLDHRQAGIGSSCIEALTVTVTGQCLGRVDGVQQRLVRLSVLNAEQARSQARKRQPLFWQRYQ